VCTSQIFAEWVTFNVHDICTHISVPLVLADGPVRTEYGRDSSDWVRKDTYSKLYQP